MKPKQRLYQSIEYMGLPSEVLGASQIEITDCRQILLSGQKGIRSYSDTEIVVDLKDCAVSIQGNRLGIVTMTGQELLIRGNLDQVRFLH